MLKNKPIMYSIVCTSQAATSYNNTLKIPVTTHTIEDYFLFIYSPLLCVSCSERRCQLHTVVSSMDSGSGIGSSSTFHFQDHSEHHFPTGNGGKIMEDLTGEGVQARHGRTTCHFYSPPTGPNSVRLPHLTAEEAGNVVWLWKWIWYSQ